MTFGPLFLVVFVSSPKVPFSYNIGQGSVIKGWDEGVMDMGVGERAKLTCTPDYAYGEGG